MDRTKKVGAGPKSRAPSAQSTRERQPSQTSTEPSAPTSILITDAASIPLDGGINAKSLHSLVWSSLSDASTLGEPPPVHPLNGGTPERLRDSLGFHRAAKSPAPYAGHGAEASVQTTSAGANSGAFEPNPLPRDAPLLSSAPRTCSIVNQG